MAHGYSGDRPPGLAGTQVEVTEMALSDQLMDLANRTKRLEDTVAAARAKNEQQLEEQRQKLQSSMDAQAQNVRAKAAQTKTEGRTWWMETTAQIERRRAEFQAKRAEHKAHESVEAAKRYADGTEEYATMLVSLADFMVDAAAEAVADATIAREQADAKSKAEVKA